MMRECPSSTKTRELLGNPSPLPSRFPSTLKISLRLRPREIFRVSGNLLGIRNGFPNTSLILMEHGYSPITVTLVCTIAHPPALYVMIHHSWRPAKSGKAAFSILAQAITLPVAMLGNLPFKYLSIVVPVALALNCYNIIRPSNFSCIISTF